MNNGKGKNMRKTKRIIGLLLALILSSAILYPAPAAQAAAKEKMYVVSGITIKDGSKTVNVKIKYKKGFIKKITSPGETQTFTYGKKFRLKKYVDNKSSGNFPGKETRTYTWKKNRIRKISVQGSADKNTFNYSYNKKKRVSKVNIVSEWTEDGKKVSASSKETYTYNKRGCYTRIIHEMKTGNETHKDVNTFQYDKKKNVTQRKMTMNGKNFPNSFYKAKISYKKGRVRKMTTSHLIPMGMDGKPSNLTISFTYKKVSVKKSYADRIAQQQWQLINTSPMLNGSSNGVMGFAW